MRAGAIIICASELVVSDYQVAEGVDCPVSGAGAVYNVKIHAAKMVILSADKLRF